MSSCHTCKFHHEVKTGEYTADQYCVNPEATREDMSLQISYEKDCPHFKKKE